MSTAMGNWITKIQLKVNNQHIQTYFIKIRRGIFQDDTSSVLWFCMCFNRLSNALNDTIWLPN